MPRSTDGRAEPHRLRILYPASLTVGGAERQMILLAERLPKDRFDVSFVMLGGWTPNADLAVAAGARVHALGRIDRRTTSGPRIAVRVMDRLFDYIQICRRERYDVVDAWLYQGYAVAALTRPFTRVPVLISGRVSLSGFKSSFGFVDRTLDSIARRRSDLIWANAAAVADDVALREGVDRDSIRIIRGGVEVPDRIRDDERRAIRAGWGVEDDAPVIGYVGSMRKGKGHDRLIEALPHVLATTPDARLVLVGGGPMRPELQQRIATLGLGSRVVLLGDVVDARPLYGGFDVFASASEAEGLPNVVLEAAAAGVGIVATSAGGTVEIIENGRTGILVPINDQASLSAGMSALIDDARLRERLGSAARDHVATGFGVDRFIRETGDMYEEMAARRGLPGTNNVGTVSG